MSTYNNLPEELAPCGVYCGACPSYKKTCLGCSSEDKAQKRSSKWGCEIRHCCYYEKKINFCIHCEEFPCTKVSRKLINSHQGDPKFIYRHEISKIFPMLKSMDMNDYLEFQKNRWTCKSCNGTIRFYHYTCNQCGTKKIIK